MGRELLLVVAAEEAVSLLEQKLIENRLLLGGQKGADFVAGRVKLSAQLGAQAIKQRIGVLAAALEGLHDLCALFVRQLESIEQHG
jgi:hypothetical protein